MTRHSPAIYAHGGIRHDQHSILHRYCRSEHSCDTWVASPEHRLSDLSNDVNRQFDRMDQQFKRVDERLKLIESDQKQFFTVTGKLDGRIDELSRK